MLHALSLEEMKKQIGSSFLSLGLVFLIIGFVQQDMTFSFESGMFNLGIIFVLSGLVAKAVEKKR